jgi:replicative DNA helicase
MGIVSIEETIICLFFASNEAWANCTLRPEEFKNPMNRHIYETMLKLQAVGNDPTDLALVYLALDTDHKHKLNLITSPIDGVHPVRIAVYQRELRKQNSATLVAEVISKHGDDNPDKVLREISAELSKTDHELSDNLPQKLSKLYAEYEALSSTTGGFLGMPTGWRDLDRALPGLVNGYLYIIAARPSMGKSAFAINLALNALKQERHVYIQALEENEQDVLRRMTANLSGIPLGNLMRGQIRDWEQVNTTQDQISGFNLTIDDQSGLRSEEICRRIRNKHTKKPIDLVIIDHLQEVRDGGQNRHQDISAALGNLRSTCKNLGIPLVVLSQLSRNVESRSKEERRPRLSDLKESGDIEAMADVVMMLYRDAYYTHDRTDKNLEVLIAKARNGQCCKVDLAFVGEFMRVTDHLRAGYS